MKLRLIFIKHAMVTLINFFYENIDRNFFPAKSVFSVFSFRTLMCSKLNLLSLMGSNENHRIQQVH